MASPKAQQLIEAELRKRLEKLTPAELIDLLRAEPQELVAPSKSGQRPAVRPRQRLPQSLAEGVRQALQAASRPLTGSETVSAVRSILPEAKEASVRAEVSRMAKAGEITKYQASPNAVPTYTVNR
jgi:hypothetical protein